MKPGERNTIVNWEPLYCNFVVKTFEKAHRDVTEAIDAGVSCSVCRAEFRYHRNNNGQ